MKCSILCGSAFVLFCAFSACNNHSKNSSDPTTPDTSNDANNATTEGGTGNTSSNNNTTGGGGDNSSNTPTTQKVMTFSAPYTVALHDYFSASADDKPRRYQLVDLDGDNTVDLLSARDKIYFFKGKGDGTFFAPKALIGVAGSVGSTVVNETTFDRVNAVSLFKAKSGVTNKILPIINNGTQAAYLLSNLFGNSGEDKATLLGGVTNGYRALYGTLSFTETATGDFDFDGKTDIAFADNWVVTTCLNKTGDNTFASCFDTNHVDIAHPPVYPGVFEADKVMALNTCNSAPNRCDALNFVNQPRLITAANLDGVAGDDLVLLDGQETLVVMYSQASANYTASAVFPSNKISRFPAASIVGRDAKLDVRNLTIADINGDKYLDILIGQVASPAQLIVMLGGSTGFRVDNIVRYDAAGSDTSDVSVGDINGDLLPDVIAANAFKVGNQAQGVLSVWLNKGAGKLELLTTPIEIGKTKSGFALRPRVSRLVDLNNDGLLDIVLISDNDTGTGNADDSTLTVLLNQTK